MTKKLMLEDLIRSGLTTTDATKLKLKPCSKDVTFQKVGKRYMSYVIPYFDIDGKLNQNFYRVRFLEERIGFKTKNQRYSQR